MSWKTTKRSLRPCHFQTRRGEQKPLGAAPGADKGGASAALPLAQRGHKGAGLAGACSCQVSANVFA